MDGQYVRLTQFHQIFQFLFKNQVIDPFLPIIGNFIELDRDHVMPLNILSRPDHTLPACADLLKQVVVLEFETWVELT
jgi:hypothetical protein